MSVSRRVPGISSFTFSIQSSRLSGVSFYEATRLSPDLFHERKQRFPSTFSSTYIGNFYERSYTLYDDAPNYRVFLLQSVHFLPSPLVSLFLQKCFIRDEIASRVFYGMILSFFTIGHVYDERNRVTLVIAVLFRRDEFLSFAIRVKFYRQNPFARPKARTIRAPLPLFLFSVPFFRSSFSLSPREGGG